MTQLRFKDDLTSAKERLTRLNNRQEQQLAATHAAKYKILKGLPPKGTPQREAADTALNLINEWESLCTDYNHAAKDFATQTDNMYNHLKANFNS